MSHNSTTVDLTQLLLHINHQQRSDQQRDTLEPPERPHPALTALIVTGGLLILAAFWGFVGLFTVLVVI